MAPLKPTTPHRLIVVPEHTRRGKKVRQHLRRVPQKLRPPYVPDPPQAGADTGPMFINPGNGPQGF